MPSRHTNPHCPVRSLRERFLDKVQPDPNSGCWLWDACTNRKGYGKIGTNEGTKLAHRVSYELYVGPIQKGLCVCHRCDVPGCVNPEHLFLGTRADNNADMCAKGRAAKGSERGHAKLTEADVIEIRWRADRGCRQVDLATEFGVGKQTISDTVRGHRWKHVGGPTSAHGGRQQ